MVGESSSTDSDELTFHQPLVLDVEDVCVPDLAGLVNYSHFTLILIVLEHLNDLHLHVKVVIFVALFFLWSAVVGDFVQWHNVLI